MRRRSRLFAKLLETLAALVRCRLMLVFLDFEASSLSDRSYPIEVGWVFADGTREAHLIQPAPGWDDWDPAAEAIHGISRRQLLADGSPHQDVARRMLEALEGHDLRASAPSWDGKWLSVLLRAAGLPRHALRLRDTDEALRDCALAILAPVLAPDQLETTAAQLLALSEIREQRQAPAHRALPDAEEERERWIRTQEAARSLARQIAAESGHRPKTANEAPLREA